MKPPIFSRMSREDYQEAPAWFGRFLIPLQQFMEQTQALFTKNIALGENIQARQYTTNFTTAAGYATGTFENITFSWSGSSLPNAVLITSITHADGTPFLGSTGTPQWRYDGGVVITYVPGLAAGTKYSITFLVI